MPKISSRETPEKLIENADDLSEEFTCSCCYDVLLDPTTLACGHTFCRFCLANWWNTTSKAECLQCRRSYNELPCINFTLRNTIERLFPEKVHERRKTIESIPNYASILVNFEKHIEEGQSNIGANGNGVCFWLCLILSAVIAFCLLFMSGVSDVSGVSEGHLNRKLVTQWTTDDVSQWVGQQGTWAKGVYDKRFKAAGIDGNLLLKMKEEDLIGPPINMALSLQRRVLMESLRRTLFEKQMKWHDFWSYKASNRAESLFLLFGLRKFPRTMMVYAYFFDYQNIFLPFLHITCKSDVTHPSEQDMANMVEPITWRQWQNFIVFTMLLPYYMVGVFAYNYLDVNYWISRIVILHAIALTGYELTQIGWLLSQQGYRKLPGLFLRNAGLAAICRVMQTILWPFIPYLISDLIFSWMFFISPFEAWNCLFRRLRNVPNQNQEAEVQEDVNAHFHFDFQFRQE